MSVLITGGTGNTGLKLAYLLHNANIPVLLASRSGTAPDGFPAVRFDWYDSSTFTTPFEKDRRIDKVYILIPQPNNILPVVKPFIDLALEKGVKQFVLLGGSSSTRGLSEMGDVQGYLDDKGVDHAMLKPTWFSDNFFSTQDVHSVTPNDELISASEDGRIPFVSPHDIAQVAFEIFTSDSKELRNAEPFVLGPELFTYDEAAALLSQIIGRKITHRRISPADLQKLFIDVGLSESSAEFLSQLEVGVAKGTEENAFNAEDRKEVKYIGKKTLRDIFEENKSVWVTS